MTQSTILRALALLLWPTIAASQATLGDLLGANAKKLSPEQFRQEVVQRTLTGPTAAGGRTELVYLGNGSLHGTMSSATDAFGYENPLEGQWTTDDSGRICTGFRMSGGPRMATAVVAPPRCQFWFKLDDKYYVSDSDYDRSAKVLERRALSSLAATPGTLGELLDSGGSTVASEEFRREVVQRWLVSATSTGIGMDVIYLPNGTIQGASRERSVPGYGIPLVGDWTVDDRGRICTAVRTTTGMTGGLGGANFNIPPRCQFWFKLGDKYYVAESDTDRKAKLAVRAPKP